MYSVRQHTVYVRSLVMKAIVDILREAEVEVYQEIDNLTFFSAFKSNEYLLARAGPHPGGHVTIIYDGKHVDGPHDRVTFGGGKMICASDPGLLEMVVGLCTGFVDIRSA